MNRFFRKVNWGLYCLGFASFLMCLFLTCPYYALSYDDRPEPVTDLQLQTLGLDHDYHQCTYVADGDTLTLEELGSIRFVGVDTPEKNHPMLPIQFMARESSAFTRALCLNRRIRLEYDPYDDDKRGKYRRVLGYLYLEDGTFVQEALLKGGYAVAYTKYPLDEEKKKHFLDLEQGAREKDINLWEEDGMAEVRWILHQKQALIEAEWISPSDWRLRFGNWCPGPVYYSEAGERISALYSAIYSLGPRDLRNRLKQLGFDQGRPRAPTGRSVTVIGMAHRKWGLIYDEFALPRISTEALGKALQALSKSMEFAESPQLQDALLKIGYHHLSGFSSSSLSHENISKDFLTSYRVQTKKKSVISWENAEPLIGKWVSVEGKIVRTHNSGKVCYLNFHRNFTRYLSLLIFKSDFWKFPSNPEDVYLNQTILVRGKVVEYEHRPEIILERPRQIKILPR